MHATFLLSSPGVVATVHPAVAVWLAAACGGACPFATSEPHADPVRRTPDEASYNSAASRAGEIGRPEAFPDDVIAQDAGD
jgi:hypothetical protein